MRAEHAERGDPLPKVVPPGPDNPLGEHAMRLGIPGGSYLIHGTNRPAGVGMPKGTFLKVGDRVDAEIESIGKLSVEIGEPS